MPRSPVVGLVVNPQAGRDIRRLVAYASVFDNSEKMNIVRKLIMTFLDLGINRYIIMPEPDGIVTTALHSLPNNAIEDIEYEYAPIRVSGTWVDTYDAVRYMIGKIDALIVLGGDGTNRIIAKTGIEVPVMPISTGTNNVFPYMIEATVAAEAVAAIVLGYVKIEEGTYKSKVIRVYEDGEYRDVAIVDVVSTSYQYVGARAIWEPEYIREVFAVLCAPYNIGLSSIAGLFKEVGHENDEAVYVRLSRNGAGKSFRAAITPGKMSKISIAEVREVRLGERIHLSPGSTLIALDGEREFLVDPGSDLTVEAIRSGPFIIDYKKTLSIARERGFFESFN
ncbi:NAD(+)/NADH kinase [Vulcanisaeta thermophila]|uniref:NAD(+)/NADH kinase n=1 Tax=Vulcanisaeta thermophila TaxID=867917 RepID=UPI000853EAD0|nr:NAD(+)/NADH kinase [Vulcanisaeta thermophila]